jgi:hypothetical protein
MVYPELEALARSWQADVPSMTDEQATEAAALLLDIQRTLDEMLTELQERA